MKLAAAIVTLTLSCIAYAEGGSIIQETNSEGPFLGLLSQDCQTIFYSPGVYKIDKHKTSVLQIANGTRILLQVYLRPSDSKPSFLSENNLKKWAEAYCQKNFFALALYPSSSKELVAVQASDIIDIKSVSLPNGDVILKIEFAKEDTPQAMEALNGLIFKNKMKMTALKETAWASLSAEVNAASTFVINHFTERVCTESRRCDILGCKKKSHCEDVPRVLQNLESAEAEGRMQFDGRLAYGVPFQELFDLRVELLSRFVMSLFVETSREQFDDAVKVTFGELKKQHSGGYYDQVSKIKLTERFELTPVEVPNLKQYFYNELKTFRK